MGKIVASGRQTSSLELYETSLLVVCVCTIRAHIRTRTTSFISNILKFSFSRTLFNCPTFPCWSQCLADKLLVDEAVMLSVCFCNSCFYSNNNNSCFYNNNNRSSSSSSSSSSSRWVALFDRGSRLRFRQTPRHHGDCGFVYLITYCLITLLLPCMVICLTWSIK